MSKLQGNLDHFGIHYFWQKCHMLQSLYDIYDKWHITKIPYVNMAVKIPVSSSTMQPPANFDIWNLKIKMSDFLCIFWNFRCISDMVWAWSRSFLNVWPTLMCGSNKIVLLKSNLCNFCVIRTDGLKILQYMAAHCLHIL